MPSPIFEAERSLGRSAGGADGGVAAPGAGRRWRRTDRLGRWGCRVLLVSAVLYLIGGIVFAIVGDAVSQPAQSEESECVDPPCFDLDLSGLELGDVIGVLWLPGYLLSIGLGLPSLLAGVAAAARGRWAAGGRWLLAFVGPVMVLVGTEVVPHAVLPCGVFPGVCEDVPGYGRSVTGRWHQLDHALVGAVPMAALYWAARRRWHPDVA